MDPLNGLAPLPVTDEMRARIIDSLDSIVSLLRTDAKQSKYHARTDIVDLLRPIFLTLGYTDKSSYLIGIKNGIEADIFSPGRTLLCVMTGQSILDQLRNQIDGPGASSPYSDNRTIASNIDRFVQMVIKD